MLFSQYYYSDQVKDKGKEYFRSGRDERYIRVKYFNRKIRREIPLGRSRHKCESNIKLDLEDPKCGLYSFESG
jgi:hypothetical protein